jgi:hypothetical protein
MEDIPSLEEAPIQILTTPSRVWYWLEAGFVVTDDSLTGPFGEQLVQMEKPSERDPDADV